MEEWLERGARSMQLEESSLQQVVGGALISERPLEETVQPRCPPLE
jgi:hypothetical protein